jgi:hypothetical protein
MLNQEVEDGELSSDEEVRSNKNDNQKNSNTDRKRSESGELDDLEDQEKNPYEQEDVKFKNQYFFYISFLTKKLIVNILLIFLIGKHARTQG